MCYLYFVAGYLILGIAFSFVRTSICLLCEDTVDKRIRKRQLNHGGLFALTTVFWVLVLLWDALVTVPRLLRKKG